MYSKMISNAQILLTGGSGLLGNNILRRLVRSGADVTTLTRQSNSIPAFADVNVRVLQGDISDKEIVRQAVDRADVVIHSAAHIHMGWKQRREAMEINQSGTENLVQAAIEYQKPMIHVSTVNVLAMGQKDVPASEETPGDGQIPSTYVVSKKAAEKIVRDAMRTGILNATIVYPGFMLGPWDWKPSSGRMIVELAKKWVPMSPAGGCSVCDVRDVAAAIASIIEQQKFGERYILAGDNVRYFDLWCAICDQLGRRKPLTVLRKPGQFVVGRFSDLFLSPGDRESDTNSAAIAMGSQFHYYDSSRAIQDLEYRIRPMEETVREAVEWLRSNGQLPPEQV